MLKKMKVSEMNLRAVAAVKAYFGKPYLSWESMINFENVSPFVMIQLQKVYLLLFLVLLSSVLGSVWLYLSNIGGSITIVGFIGSLMWYRSIPARNEKRRVSLLMAAAFWKGAFVGFLIGLFSSGGHRIIITTVGGTAVAFGCFAAVARRYKRERGYTYSYGCESAFLLVPIWLQAAARTFGGENDTLYFYAPCFGICNFLWYVLLYSQEMVEQTRRGNFHYSHEHCLKFFTDMPAVLFRVISILKEAFKRYRRN